MRKLTFGILVSLLVFLVVAPIISEASLEVNVEVGSASIMPNEPQEITVTSSNAGKGILFVLQPAEGKPWEDFLNDHPLLRERWISLPESIKDKIKKVIGGKILSFKCVSIEQEPSVTVIFPIAFTGINGQPSTAIAGKYKVLLAFFSLNDASDCKLIEKDFDCASWFVVPELPFGTVTALTITLISFAGYSVVRRKHLLPT